eukprot:2515051-Prymnesium_polylepis.1
MFARCLADALQTVLPWLIDSSQVACQEGKSCFSNTRYIQDMIHHCMVVHEAGIRWPEWGEAGEFGGGPRALRAGPM